MRAMAVRMRRLASRTNLRKIMVTMRMPGRTARVASASREEIVEGVHVRGHAGDEAADGIAVEIAHRQTLHVAEDFTAHVVHGLLADALHDANLDVLSEEIEHEHGKKEQAEQANARPCGGFREQVIQRGNKVAVDSLPENQWRGEFERRDDRD